MPNTNTQLKIGTRSSKLALKQTKLVLKKIQNIPGVEKFFSFRIIRVKTEGDIKKSKILESGYKGFFTKKIDDLLVKKKIDFAVHSAKDIPSKIDKKLIISAFLKREDPRDVLLCKKNHTFSKLPKNITIGTSSIRRKMQIQSLRPDLFVKHMRGNIETRIKKFQNNEYYAIILALAGLKRLSIKYKKKNILKNLMFVPAGGQGAIAITVCKKNKIVNNLLKRINHRKTEIEVKTERKFLEKINADCDSPVGANAKVINKIIKFLVAVPNKNRNGIFLYKSQTEIDKHEVLGTDVANFLKKKFGKDFIKKVKQSKKVTFLLTRPTKQSNELKKKMNFKNFNFISCPFLTINPVKINKNQIKEIKFADAIIFSSANAVNMAKKYMINFNNKVFCVGKDTKLACLKNNIKNVYSSNGNVLDLINLIMKKNKDKKKKLVYISAKQTAVNLLSILKSKKFNVKKIIVYESKKINKVRKKILNIIKLNKLDFVIFFSKKTATAFNEMILKYKLQTYLNDIKCISLSKEIEKLLKKNNFNEYHLCSNPDRESFLKLINLLHITSQKKA